MLFILPITIHVREMDSHEHKMLENVPEETDDKPHEDDYIERIRRLQLDLADKSNECELFKIKLAQSNQDVDSLSQELNECKLTMFENSEAACKVHEEVVKSKKLEEDYVRLMSDFLNLSEETSHYRQDLSDKYLEKSNLINSLDCLETSGAYKFELEQCKIELNAKTTDLSLAAAKVRHLEEENSSKDKTISELRKVFDDAKVTHRHELMVLDEYIQSLKNTIASYEQTLTCSSINL